MKQWKALLFDMDGLMIDTERLYFDSEREIAARYGKTISDATLWKMMGKKPIESIAIFIEDLGLDCLAPELLAVRDQMMLEKMQTDLVMMDGLTEILSAMKHRLVLAIATGAIRPFVDVMLKRFHLEGFFSYIQTSEDIRYGKPHPEIYQKTAMALSIDPADCIVLEDSANGVNSAKNATCHTIAVPSVYTASQDFSGADYIASDLFKARDYIEALLLPCS